MKRSAKFADLSNTYRLELNPSATLADHLRVQRGLRAADEAEVKRLQSRSADPMETVRALPEGSTSATVEGLEELRSSIDAEFAKLERQMTRTPVPDPLPEPSLPSVEGMKQLRHYVMNSFQPDKLQYIDLQKLNVRQFEGTTQIQVPIVGRKDGTGGQL